MGRPAQAACGLLFFNCFFLRNVSKAIFFFYTTHSVTQNTSRRSSRLQQQREESFRGSRVLKHGCASGASKKLMAADPWLLWVVFHFVRTLLSARVFSGQLGVCCEGMLL